MKKIYFVIFVLVFALLTLTYGRPAFAGDAYDDLEDVYEDTMSFDGGYGSTINTSPEAYDSEN